MAKIELLERLFKEYRIWTIKLGSATRSIEDNILQKQSGSKIEEKITSVAISWVLVFMVSSIFSLFGLTLGILGSLFFFALGLVLSRYINKKLFGEERNKEEIKDDEKELLAKMEALMQKHHEIRDALNNGSMKVFFTNYPTLKREFGEMKNRLLLYNASNLALKFRYKHTYLTKRYCQEVDTFHQIYANKTKD